MTSALTVYALCVVMRSKCSLRLSVLYRGKGPLLMTAAKSATALVKMRSLASTCVLYSSPYRAASKRLDLEYLQLNHAVHNKLVSFIWSIADDCLRDVYVRGKYRDVILPMVVFCASHCLY